MGRFDLALPLRTEAVGEVERALVHAFVNALEAGTRRAKAAASLLTFDDLIERLDRALAHPVAQPHGNALEFTHVEDRDLQHEDARHGELLARGVVVHLVPDDLAFSRLQGDRARGPARRAHRRGSAA